MEETAKFTTFIQSLRVHFWSVFGYSDDYANWFKLHCEGNHDRLTTGAFGEIIFALYHVGTVLVLINMLIAIMSGTLQKTTGESDIQWQFHRTRVSLCADNFVSDPFSNSVYTDILALDSLYSYGILSPTADEHSSQTQGNFIHWKNRSENVHRAFQVSHY